MAAVVRAAAEEAEKWAVEAVAAAVEATAVDAVVTALVAGWASAPRAVGPQGRWDRFFRLRRKERRIQGQQ